MLILNQGDFSMQKRWLKRFENYKLALSNMQETVDCIKQNGQNKIYTMALIQSFEMAFELAWKSLKDYQEYEGIKSETPRETIKNGFLRNMIEDGTLWINMMEARNKTSHTYREEYAKIVVEDILKAYIPAMLKLKGFLESKVNE